VCVTSGTADDLCLIVRSREAADEILERYLRVGIRKALDLGSARGFDRAVGKLAALLGARSTASDDAAVRAALGVLDVDWAASTAAQRRTLISRGLEAAGRRTATVPRAVQAVFGDAATEVVQATRDAARRGQGLTIAADFNALDKRIVRHLTSSQANFVRDEYGRRNDAFGERARQIVADGLEAGLGREDIAADLERAAQDVLAGRSSFYWEVVAGSFVSRGRSFAQLSSYAEAGVDRYLIEAVLDERTTEICRFLHGKSFSVATGLRTFERVDAEPDLIKDLTPWVREAIDPATGAKTLFVERGEERVRVADVTRSAVGTRDDRGEFGRGLSERDLANLGVSFPPYHGLCRTTTVADV
jgi:SPP1 gp7 family putative phage head morphogenesis protein